MRFNLSVRSQESGLGSPGSACFGFMHTKVSPHPSTSSIAIFSISVGYMAWREQGNRVLTYAFDRLRLGTLRNYEVFYLVFYTVNYSNGIYIFSRLNAYYST
jgi:hypothetical protein